MKLWFLSLCLALFVAFAQAGPYAPAAEQPGSTAIHYDSTSIVGWARGYQDLVRGPADKSNPGLGNVSYGSGTDALDASDGEQNSSLTVVSLGDGGRITLTFERPIANGSGPDFAVFENGISDSFLELAFVEVSSDGLNFTRFRAVSLTQTATQVDAFPRLDELDPTDLYNLAGKYRVGFGTPFDLAELTGTPGLDINNVTHVRIVDVVGSINPLYGSLDSLSNLINDPWPTVFGTGGFDLDAVGVLNFAPVPEPCTPMMFLSAALIVAVRRRR